MELSFELFGVALLVLVFNVLDSVTTHLACGQYVDGELKCEANPIMRWLMLKSGLLAVVVKQGFVLALVVWFVVVNDLVSLRYVSIMFGLVVLNNAVVVVSRAIAKRKVASPAKRLLGLLHIPDRYAYLVIIVVIFVLSMGIYELVWGRR